MSSLSYLMCSVIAVLFICQQQLCNAQKSRIFGGHFAEKNQFPYQVALLRDGQLKCGGSLLSNTWIVTAAHCLLEGLQPYPAERFEVLAGVLEHQDHNGGQRLKAKKLYPHKCYAVILNDIGLIETIGEFVIGDNVQPIALRRTPVPDGTEMVISGWGWTETGDGLSDRLRFTKMKSISLKQCTDEIGVPYHEIMISSIICVVAAEDGSHGPCIGDSGSPAVVNNELVGVTNFARPSCGVNPDGYANVTNFVGWLEDHIKASGLKVTINVYLGSILLLVSTLSSMFSLFWYVKNSQRNA